MPPLSRSHIVRMLAARHNVVPAHESRVAGRLQHLQRLSFPPTTNTGRGVAAVYGIGEVVQLALAFEIMQLGLTPERMVNLFTIIGNWLPRSAGYIGERIEESGERPPANDDFFLSFDPCALFSKEVTQGLAKGDETHDNAANGVWAYTAAMSPSRGEGSEHERSIRAATVNLTLLLGSCAHHFAEAGIISAKEFGSDLVCWSHNCGFSRPWFIDL